MDTNVPYMPSVTNLSKILDAIQKAGVPEVFNLDFLKDLGFTSSNDRPVIKVLKYLGMLDSSGRPQTAYREFVDHTKAKVVLAGRLRAAFDDLYLSDKDAHTKSAEQLKGWFKTKTAQVTPSRRRWRPSSSHSRTMRTSRLLRPPSPSRPLSQRPM